MTGRDEKYMEYVYALEKLQAASSEFEKYDHDNIKCDWLRLAKALDNATSEISVAMYQADKQKEKNNNE